MLAWKAMFGPEREEMSRADWLPSCFLRNLFIEETRSEMA